MGDWHIDEKSGEDLGARASDIATLGVTSSVWVTPFIARPGTSLPIEHPETFVHAPSGESAIANYNWRGPYYTFGTTRPLTQKYLRDLARSPINAGTSYVKANSINAAAIGNMRREADVTGGDAYVIGS